jgi:asparagine synthase (glutamine-hydrolysing)
MTNSKVGRICLDDRPTPGGGSKILHWDGRLDNRDDLLLRLGKARDASDAALVLAAFKRSDTDGLLHLIGDWSVVIDDRASGSVILASDFAGVRPLYYHIRHGHLFWSNCLQALVESTGASDLDEHYVAAFLVFGGCPKHTPYRGIYSVPPGHSIRISARETAIRPFWTLPAGDAIRYQSQHRYQEHLRALFREAVLVRLRTSSPVLAELSGGLDSSSVVSMGNHLIRSRATEAPRIIPVSYGWQGSLDLDFIREVESFCGMEGLHISTQDHPLASGTEVHGAIPGQSAPLLKNVARIAGDIGARVLLTGQNGDLMMGNWFDDSLQVAASLRRLCIGRGSKEALAWSKILRLPISWVLWRAFRASLPKALAPADAFTMSDGSYARNSGETSISPDFCGRTGVLEPGRFFSGAWKQAPPERRKHFQALSMMLEMRTLQTPEPFQDLDYTHPFAHRPLVEFLMSIPADILCGPGEPRKLMRRTFSDLWPPKLQKRRSKCLFNRPWLEALQPMARELLRTRRLQVVERGFVERTSLLSRLERLAAGVDCNEAQLRQIILLEFWLRGRQFEQMIEAA